MPRSAYALAALATSAVPGLDVVATCAPQRVTPDMQMTGLIDAAGRHWTVRCPLHPVASAQFEGELALVHALERQVEAGRLPFEVPRVVATTDLPEGGHLAVSPTLRGTPLDLDALRPGPGLAASLGAAIAALHELDGDVVADVGLPVYTADSYRRRCLAEVDEAARTGRVPSVLLNRWERALEDVAMWRFRATPVHADLAPDQVLVADHRVTGIVSFAEAHVGDPAQDLAWLLASAPEDSLDAIIEAYVMGRPERADSALLDRAMLTSELALARWLLHGVRTDDADVVEDATAMLEDLAGDVLHAPPIGYHEPVVVPQDLGEVDAAPQDAHGAVTVPLPSGEPTRVPTSAGVPGAEDGAPDPGTPAAEDGAPDPETTQDDALVAAPDAGAVLGVHTTPVNEPVTEAFDMEALRRAESAARAEDAERERSTGRAGSTRVAGDARR